MANDILLHIPASWGPHNGAAIREGVISGSHFSDQSDAGGMRYTEHTFGQAQTLGLFETSQILVAAPASGSYIDFLGATLYHDFDNAAFGVADGGENIVICLSGTAAANVEMTEVGRGLTAGFLDQSASVGMHLQPMPISGSTSAYKIQEAVPLALTLKTAGITGGGTSKLRVRTYYRTLSGSWTNDLSAGT